MRILPRATFRPMGTRRRRRLDAVLLALAVVVVGVVALAAGAAARTERITRLWAGAEVGWDAPPAGEVIDYDFRQHDRHGIFRDVPGLDPAVPSRSPRPAPHSQSS